MPERWPFVDDKALAVITLKRITSGASPVLYAHHGWDGSWQFLDGEDCTPEDAALVGLGEMVSLDPTIRELAALPHGFIAFRSDLNSPWNVEYREDDDHEEHDGSPSDSVP